MGLSVQLVWDHPAWFENTDSLLEEEVRQAADALISEEEDSDTDLVAKLEELELTDKARWQFLVLLQRPKQQIEVVAQAVRSNLADCEKARAKVKHELTTL